MRYEQPIPFYMAYPFLLPLDQEQAQEKDLQVMKSFYSRRAARIQEKADRECDRMEYVCTYNRRDLSGGTGKLRKQKRRRGTSGSDRSDLIQRDVSQTEPSQKTEKILLTEL